jgi:WhiB family redox-sensing transcriptional regulator
MGAQFRQSTFGGAMLDPDLDPPCRQTDPEVFFDPGESDTHGRGFARLKRERRALALSICSECPLSTRQACLEVALINGERVGVWGGTTPEQRAEMLRRREEVAA